MFVATSSLYHLCYTISGHGYSTDMNPMRGDGDVNPVHGDGEGRFLCYKIDKIERARRMHRSLGVDSSVVPGAAKP